VGGLSVLTRCLLARRPAIVGSFPFNVEDGIAALTDGRATLASMVPTMLSRLLDQEEFRAPQRLRCILVGGAATTPQLIRRAKERRFPVRTTYGMTEMASQVATSPEDASTLPDGAVGRLLPGMEAKTASDGRLMFRGPSLMLGYYRSTGSQMIDPEDWFTSADVGEVVDTDIVCVRGRSDDIIISGGEKIWPGHVEALLSELPGVVEACAFGQVDQTWGQVVCAAVVVDEEFQSVLERVRQLQGPLKPRRIAFVVQLTRTATGKVDRQNVAAQCADKLRSVSPARSVM
jgi:acyl-CoA synthetase (AMP-forming)/AMP-acid ligase II